MLWLSGLPLVGWLKHRLEKSEELDAIIFAVPEGRENESLACYLQEAGAQIFIGPEKDVLGRIYQAATHSKATHIVRICADSPFTDAKEVNRLIRFYFKGDYDYAYNHIPKANTYPDGLGAEILSQELLEKIHKKAQAPSQREHALNYIWDHQDEFRIGTFDPPEKELQYPKLKLDVDTHEQYLHLLQMKLNPDMSAKEIVARFLA